MKEKKELSTKNKEKAIKILLKNDFEYISDNSAGEEWIETILINGFKGYNNMTLKELEREIKEREIKTQLKRGEEKC